MAEWIRTIDLAKITKREKSSFKEAGYFVSVMMIVNLDDVLEAGRETGKITLWNFL